MIKGPKATDNDEYGLLHCNKGGWNTLLVVQSLFPFFGNTDDRLCIQEILELLLLFVYGGIDGCKAAILSGRSDRTISK